MFRLRELYACPDCQATLKESDGLFQCLSCGSKFPCNDGIAYLCPSTLHGEAVKNRERAGWRKVFEENLWSTDAAGILALPDSSDDPYWKKVAASMELTDAAIDPRPGLVGVDLACGIGWATARFARKGVQMLALDFNDTEFNGLRAAIKTHALGIDFDTICCDSECIPLRDEAVDFVFICSALHHFTRPNLALRECRRILKPGGIVVDICEAFKTGWRDRERESKHETLVSFRSAGINEQSFKQRDYERMYADAGFELMTFLMDYDKPTHKNPGADWINSDIARGTSQHAKPWARALAKIICATPAIHLLRWYRLHFRIPDRVFVARK